MYFLCTGYKSEIHLSEAREVLISSSDLPKFLPKKFLIKLILLKVEIPLLWLANQCATQSHDKSRFIESWFNNDNRNILKAHKAYKNAYSRLHFFLFNMKVFYLTKVKYMYM